MRPRPSLWESLLLLLLLPPMPPLLLKLPGARPLEPSAASHELPTAAAPAVSTRSDDVSLDEPASRAACAPASLAECEPG